MQTAGLVRSFNRKALIVTGELSGESHALHLVNAINKLLPLEWSAVGSQKLKAAGIEILYDYRDISVTGLSEVLPKMGQIWRAYRALKRYLREAAPSLLILVDFPGFNLRLAGIAKKMAIPVVYFIPPQVWAWRSGRITRIKRDIDLVISILPFEKALYDQKGIPCVYVGHPYMATLRPKERGTFLQELGVERRQPIVTIMPGSRQNEIARLMPVLLHVVDRLRMMFKDMAVLLPIAESIERSFMESFIQEHPEVHVLEGSSIDALASSDIALVASGSATLEAAILGCPAIVIYKISSFSFLVAKHVVKVGHISLPNLIAGQEVFPEYVQDLQPEIIAQRAQYMLNNERKKLKDAMEHVRKKLGTTDSYALACDAILHLLERIYGPLFPTAEIR